MNEPRKKLIESMMPIKSISEEAEREKTARGGMPSAVHIWWSRRSMAAARSVLFASLVDDPSEHPELFSTENEQQNELERLINLTSELAVVENATNQTLLNEARKEIDRYCSGSLPTIFDPFVGAGTIPVEAHRFGLKTISSDLNAVAVLIATVLSDIPARFGNVNPVHPQERASTDESGIASDVKYYGEWMQKEAFQRIGKLYPRVRLVDTTEELDVSAWIWARTVKCPSPSCNCNIPLSSSYDLARKKGSEAWVEPIVEDGDVRFVIHRGVHQNEKATPKVAQTAVFKCPACGEITPDSYVKECGKKHQIHSQMIAVVADDGRKRLFLEPNEEQIAAAQVSTPDNIPHGALPNNPRRFSPPSFGLTDYADLFTDRQLVYITTMIQLAKEVQEQVENQAIKAGMPDDRVPFVEGGKGALAYAQAIRLILMLTVSKLLDRCSNVCSWDASGPGSLRNVFSRGAMPMIWDYAEGNPFSRASGSFINALERTCDAMTVLPAGVESTTIQADATVPFSATDTIISTDIPYYDRTGYADLSDFFYVWLRFGLADVFPDLFTTELSPKKEELTSFLYRWQGDRKQAKAFYAEGLAIAFKNIYQNITDRFPSSVAAYYQHDLEQKQTAGATTDWEIIISAIYNAGFMIMASWPLGRNEDIDIKLAESRGIPITIILRKRPEDATEITRRAFVTALKRELPGIIETMADKVSMSDLRPSVIGKAWNVFSRYRRVLDADGTQMKPYQASRIIEQELDMHLSSVYDKVNEHNIQEESNHG